MKSTSKHSKVMVKAMFPTLKSHETMADMGRLPDTLEIGDNYFFRDMEG